MRVVEGFRRLDFSREARRCERTFRRWRDRLRDEGPTGLDRRIGKPSSRRAAADEILRMLGLYRERYAGFTVKHFHEQLVKRHDYRLGYTVMRLHLHRSGLIRPAPRRSAHRKKRPRRPLPGMLLHQDASRHPLLDDAPPLDLVVTLDDATSEVYLAFLVEEEGTPLKLPRPGRDGGSKGSILRSLHRPGSHYYHTPKAGGRGVADAAHPGRPGAGPARHRTSPPTRQRHATAASAVFRTLQGRLPKELRLAGITSIPAANRWLAEVNLLEHNARFVVPAEQEGLRLCRRPGRRLAQDSLHPGRACGRRRQYRQREAAFLADPAVAVTPALHARQGAGSRIPGCPAGGLLGAAPARRLRCLWPADQHLCAGRLSRFGRQKRLWVVDIAPRYPQPTTTTTEAVNSCATKTGQPDALATTAGR